MIFQLLDNRHNSLAGSRSRPGHGFLVVSGEGLQDAGVNDLAGDVRELGRVDGAGGFGQADATAAVTRVPGIDDLAAAGDEVDVRCTGVRSGSVILPQVSIGGRLADIVSVGVTPGVPGTQTVRVRVPTGIHAGSVRVRLTYLGRSSDAVTMAVK